MSSLAWGRRLDIDQAGGQADTGQKTDLCAAPTKPNQLLKVTSSFLIFIVFTLKYESSRCWQLLWSELESFHGIYICICYNVVRARVTGCHFVPIVSVCNTAYDKHLKLRIWKLINSDMWTRQKRLLWRRSAVDQRLYRPVQATNAHTEKEA